LVETRLSLFHKCLKAFHLIWRAHGGQDSAPLLGNALCKSFLSGTNNTLQDTRHGCGRFFGELVGQRIGSLKQVFQRPNFVDETHFQRLWSRNHFRPENHVQSVASPYTARQPGRPTPCRDRAQVKFGQTHLRTFSGRQSEVARQGQLQPPAKAVPVKHCNHGLGEIFDRIQNPQTLVKKRAQSSRTLNPLRKLFQIHTHGKIL